jgi:hypothetical protein
MNVDTEGVLTDNSNSSLENFKEAACKNKLYVHMCLNRTEFPNEELLERKVSGSSLGNRDYGRRRSAALTMRHPSNRKNWH